MCGIMRLSEKEKTQEVNNSFSARLSAFFRFVFSGLRWGDQTVDVR